MLIYDFKLMFPEFKSESVDKYLGLIENVYPCYYGANYEKGTKCDKVTILYLVAHLLSLKIRETNNENSSGEGAEIMQKIASRSVDGVSETFMNSDYDSKGEKAFFAQTPYGLQYISMIMQRNGARWA